MGDEALLTRLDEWFTPFQEQTRGLDDVTPASLSEGLMALVPYEVQRDLDRLVPTHFEAPTGQRLGTTSLCERSTPVRAVLVTERHTNARSPPPTLLRSDCARRGAPGGA